MISNKKQRAKTIENILLPFRDLTSLPIILETPAINTGPQLENKTKVGQKYFKGGRGSKSTFRRGQKYTKYKNK